MAADPHGPGLPHADQSVKAIRVVSGKVDTKLEIASFARIAY